MGWTIGRGSGLSFSSARCVRLAQTSLAEHDHVIEALAADSPDHPLGHTHAATEAAVPKAPV
jgi:hypothetical protein